MCVWIPIPTCQARGASLHSEPDSLHSESDPVKSCASLLLFRAFQSKQCFLKPSQAMEVAKISGVFGQKGFGAT